MASPDTISDIISVLVTISTGGGTSVQSFSDPVFVSTFAANASFPDRIKAYVGTAAEKKAQLIADGFSTTSPAYLQVSAANAQQGPPRTIYVGRADPGDLTWDETLTAIWDEANAENFSLYALAADTRDEAEIESIADWVHQRGFVLFGAQTNSSSLLNDTPGNVARNILAKGYDSTFILYHDPAVASGYGPARLTGRTGPFALPGGGGTIKLRIDGGAEQTFTLVSAAASLLGSNTEPFAFADADTMTLTVDGGATQTVTVALAPASVTSANVETFNFPESGRTLLVRVNGGAVQVVTFSGTAASVLGTNAEPFVIVASDELHVDIDGAGSPQVFVFTGTETTAQDVVDLINATATGFIASVDAGRVRLTSNRLGALSEVEILNTSDAALLTALGLSVGSTLGSGFADFLDAATAAEVAAEIDNDTANIVAVDDGGAVRLDSSVSGTSSRIQVVGGTANSILDFNTNEFAGTGSFGNGAAVGAAEVVAWLAASLYGLTITVDTGAVRLTTKTRGSGSSIAIGGGAVAATLGLSGTANGSGDFVNAASAAASEVATKVAATITGGSADAVSSAVRISSSTSGSSSTVEITGGTLATVLFSATSATGTGVQEDYAECAWIGRCITFPLDQTNGQGTWTKAPLIGIFPDKLSAAQRQTLQQTLKVNTYERRLGRSETGKGTVCFGVPGPASFRYIDQRVSADWLRARMTEALNNVLNNLADAKAKAPYTNGGIALLSNAFRAVLERSANNGHTILDTTPITSETDTGITIPGIELQTASNVASRRISGFNARQQFQDAIHGADVIIDLTVQQAA